MKNLLFKCLLLLFIFTGTVFSQMQNLENGAPFKVGEELEYSMKWGPFKVGTGYLRVLGIEEKNGVDCYHLNLSVETNSFADPIYKVRSQFHSYVSVEDPKVIFYRINQHEGKTHRDASVYFDWDKKIVTYHRDGEDPKEPVSIEDYTWDPLSVVYYFRTLVDEGLKHSSLPATDGKKHVFIDVENRGIVKKETQMGQFDAFHVIPNTKEIKGVFKKSKKSKINMWYSNDDRRYPILIKSKVIVGSFVAELKKVRNLNDEEAVSNL